jgi:hypothetical protein
VLLTGGCQAKKQSYKALPAAAALTYNHATWHHLALTHNLLSLLALQYHPAAPETATAVSMTKGNCQPTI